VNTTQCLALFLNTKKKDTGEYIVMLERKEHVNQGILERMRFHLNSNYTKYFAKLC
jgi:hypothetical protein